LSLVKATSTTSKINDLLRPPIGDDLKTSRVLTRMRACVRSALRRRVRHHLPDTHIDPRQLTERTPQDREPAARRHRERQIGTITASFGIAELVPATTPGVDPARRPRPMRPVRR
jgi:hypothetical protein